MRPDPSWEEASLAIDAWLRSARQAYPEGEDGHDYRDTQKLLGALGENAQLLYLAGRREPGLVVNVEESKLARVGQHASSTVRAWLKILHAEGWVRPIRPQSQAHCVLELTLPRSADSAA